ERLSDGGTWTEIATLGPGVTSYNDTDVTTNVAYYLYRARAHNACGDSRYGFEGGVLLAPPAAPYPLTATVGATHLVNVSWPADAGGFRIERAADASGVPGSWAELAVLAPTNALNGGYSDATVMTNATY